MQFEAYLTKLSACQGVSLPSEDVGAQLKPSRPLSPVATADASYLAATLL